MSGPAHGNGHALPPVGPHLDGDGEQCPCTPINSDPRPGATDRRASGGGVVAARGSDLPPIGMIIRDGEHHCQQLINLLGRDYDPASVSTVEAWPGMLLADLELARLKSDVRQVLRGLADLAELRHPPAGSAVPVMFIESNDVRPDHG